MREAGFAWNDEKKELEGIEKKPAVEMKSAEESLGIDSETYNKIVDECIYGNAEQSPAWSEEDENRFRNLVYLVEHSNEGKGTKEGFVKFINRLQSLRPQPHWKPSEEQIEALHDTIIYVKDSMFPSKNVLKKLYGQLKKLREE